MRCYPKMNGKGKLRESNPFGDVGGAEGRISLYMVTLFKNLSN